MKRRYGLVSRVMGIVIVLSIVWNCPIRVEAIEPTQLYGYTGPLMANIGPGLTSAEVSMEHSGYGDYVGKCILCGETLTGYINEGRAEVKVTDETDGTEITVTPGVYPLNMDHKYRFEMIEIHGYTMIKCPGCKKDLRISGKTRCKLKIYGYRNVRVRTQPVSQTANTGDNVTFSLEILDAAVSRWQIRTDAGFSDIAEGVNSEGTGFYGVNGQELSITNVSGSMDGAVFRCVALGGRNDEVISDEVRLTVNDDKPPRVSITKSPEGKTTGSVTITVNAVDDGKGLPEMPYSYDGGITYSGSNTHEVTSNKAVEVRVKDREGNEYSETVIIDQIEDIKASADEDPEDTDIGNDEQGEQQDTNDNDMDTGTEDYNDKNDPGTKNPGTEVKDNSEQVDIKGPEGDEPGGGSGQENNSKVGESGSDLPSEPNVPVENADDPSKNNVSATDKVNVNGSGTGINPINTQNETLKPQTSTQDKKENYKSSEAVGSWDAINSLTTGFGDVSDDNKGSLSSEKTVAVEEVPTISLITQTAKEKSSKNTNGSGSSKGSASSGTTAAGRQKGDTENKEDELNDPVNLYGNGYTNGLKYNSGNPDTDENVVISGEEVKENTVVYSKAPVVIGGKLKPETMTDKGKLSLPAIILIVSGAVLLFLLLIFVLFFGVIFLYEKEDEGDNKKKYGIAGISFVVYKNGGWVCRISSAIYDLAPLRVCFGMIFTMIFEGDMVNIPIKDENRFKPISKKIVVSGKAVLK
ncbi:MAG: hypothetical protein K6B28_07730 [Lachnospiraceae bacterium]|nr:hypothetical protein [Lachnospiraceae bacterium]